VLRKNLDLPSFVDEGKAVKSFYQSKAWRYELSRVSGRLIREVAIGLFNRACKVLAIKVSSSQQTCSKNLKKLGYPFYGFNAGILRERLHEDLLLTLNRRHFEN
jgi:hypothetical protein